MCLKEFFKSINTCQEKNLKKRSLRVIFSEVLLLVCSAFLLAAAFPGFMSKNGIGFFCFFSLIPLFSVIHNTNFKTVWFYGFLFGYLFYQIFNFWLSAFHPLANVLVQVIKGTEFSLLFMCLKVADRYVKEKYSCFAEALLWVSYSYLSQSWFAGYPYGNVSYALYKYRVLIQIASFSGIWLLNFIIVFPQAVLGRFFCSRMSSTVDRKAPGLKNYVCLHKITLFFYLILVVFQIIFGIFRLSYLKKQEPVRSYDIITVQHNADSWKGGFSTYQNNFNMLKKLTNDALAQHRNADIVVWSETAFVPSVNWYIKYKYNGAGKGFQFDYLRKTEQLVDNFVSFCTSLSLPLITGNPYGVLAKDADEPYDNDGYWNKDDYNSVILFDEGKIKDYYLKQHLVPFTEHFPYKKQLPLLYKILLANDYNWWEKGTESVVMHTSNGLDFSSPICFEDVFGALNAEFVEKGAKVLINLTNDSWSGSVAAERQHAYMAVFRAVETGVPVLRSTNSGLTCLILPTGEIVDEMEPFTQGYKMWTVPVYDMEKNTLYVRYKDFPVRICVCFCVLLLFFVLSREVYFKIKRTSKQDADLA